MMYIHYIFTNWDSSPTPNAFSASPNAFGFVICCYWLDLHLAIHSLQSISSASPSLLCLIVIAAHSHLILLFLSNSSIFAFAVPVHLSVIIVAFVDF